MGMSDKAQKILGEEALVLKNNEIPSSIESKVT